MSAIVLNENFENAGEIALSEKFEGINSHNLHLYVKSYWASIRANTARVKNRSAVSGGGKKPKAQKGSGGARWGALRSPLFVGGGVAHGPKGAVYKIKKINKCGLYKEKLKRYLLSKSVRGTVILSPEGVNGTIAGKKLTPLKK